VEGHVGMDDSVDDLLADLSPLGCVQLTEDVQLRATDGVVQGGQVVALQHGSVVVGPGKLAPRGNEKRIIHPCTMLSLSFMIPFSAYCIRPFD
jgi:hypothetical protein